MAEDFSLDWQENYYPGETVTQNRLLQDYWDIVETGGKKVEVEYGNDLDTQQYFSGFPKRDAMEGEDLEASEDSESMSSSHYYKTTGWNLNNIARYSAIFSYYIYDIFSYYIYAIFSYYLYIPL